MEPGASGKETSLDKRLKSLKKLVGKHLSAEQADYWSIVWEGAVQSAHKKMSDNRTWFYRLQAVSSASAVIIPALVGLDLSGTGGVAIRWTTFAVGLIGALAAAALQLFRSGSRWRMNRHCYADLIRAGQNFSIDVAMSKGCGDEQWKVFQKQVTDIIEHYDNVYDSEVITPTQPGGAGR